MPAFAIVSMISFYDRLLILVTRRFIGINRGISSCNAFIKFIPNFKRATTAASFATAIVRGGGRTTHHRFKGTMNCIVRIVNEEGILSLWRGNGSSVLRYYPSIALNFSLKVATFLLLGTPFTVPRRSTERRYGAPSSSPTSTANDPHLQPSSLTTRVTASTVRRQSQRLRPPFRPIQRPGSIAHGHDAPHPTASRSPSLAPSSQIWPWQEPAASSHPPITNPSLTPRPASPP
ncbi:hypothetical protein ACLOJK_025244 [Asimina triloba]